MDLCRVVGSTQGRGKMLAEARKIRKRCFQTHQQTLIMQRRCGLQPAAFNVNRGTLRSLALVCHVAMCARPLYLHDDINIRALFPSLHSSW